MMMHTAAQSPDRAQYLTFSLAGGDYAVGVLKVREIIEHEVVTRVPSTPAFIRGVINLRGSVVPVVDLGRKFGLAESPTTKRTCIVIVEVDTDSGRIVMGVLADAVNQVVEFRPEDIETPPSFGTPIRVDYLQGLGKLDGRFVLILDTDRVLSSGELLAVHTAPARVSGDAAADGADTEGPFA
jgi:purine-binding chemotaxis protein CheW